MFTDIAAVLLLMAGSCLAGTNFRVSSAKMLATEGFPVTLECRFSRQTDDRYLIWGYVPPGTNGLKKLLYWGPGSQEPVFLSGGSHRYVASKNFRRSVMSLKISNVTALDTSRYFCQVSNGLWDVNATDWCGCGVSLAVEPVRAPRVRLLTPLEGEKVWATRATLTCEAEGFYPGEISFQWRVNWRWRSVIPEQGEAARVSDGTYTSSSQLHIPFPEWDKVRNVHCLVTHVSSTSPLIRTVSRAQGIDPLSKCLQELNWVWITAALGGLILYTGIVLCVSWGVWTCRQRRSRSFSKLGSGSFWANSEIPMERVGADGGKGP